METRDPFLIRFSQDSVSAQFRDGTTVEDLAAALKAGEVEPGAVEPIRICLREGNWYTLDNRRLLAFRLAGVDVPVVPATPTETEAQRWKFTTTCEGLKVRIR